MRSLAYKSNLLIAFSNHCKAFSRPLVWCSTGIQVTVHNMLDAGNERKFEKGLVKLRGTWPTTFEIRMMETTCLSWRSSVSHRIIMRSIDSYLNEDKDAVTSVNTCDISSINWKLKVKAICCVIEDYVETTRTTRFEITVKSRSLIYYRWSEQLLRNIRWCWPS